MDTKSLKCNKCGENKVLSSEYFKPEKKTKLGFDTTCRRCRAAASAKIRRDNPKRFREKDRQCRQTERYKNYQKKYQTEKREEISEKKKIKYNQNKEPYLERSKQQKIRWGKKYKEYLKEYSIKNKDKLRAYVNNRLKNDPTYKLKHTFRNRFRKLIKGYHKNNSVLKYLGCDIKFLKKWLEEKFEDGMSWDNHGSYWHIDHILPCSMFDFNNENDLYKCWNYTNLQPLLASENLKKRDKVGDIKGINIDSYDDYIKIVENE